MNKIDRAAYVVERLDEIYPETPVPLNHKSKFELLIAVLLSAQCTDERVNQVTPQLFSLADNPLDMSKLKTEKIYEIIRPCGLAPQKSSNISKLSIMIIEKHQGLVPSNFEDLDRLRRAIDPKEIANRGKMLPGKEAPALSSPGPHPLEKAGVISRM